jgi:Rhodopirellula transposase DDE domain
VLIDEVHIGEIRSRYEGLAPVMDERVTRLWAACEAKALGRGGIAAVTEATGILGKRIWSGMRELKEIGRRPPTEPPRQQRVRRPGAGRKPLTEKDPTLLTDLDGLVEPVTRGDPESPLRWTCKSVRKLADELRAMGHQVGPQKVSELLHDMDYSLQGTRKTREGSAHPDRNEQFEHINAQARTFQRAGEPVISVDTKKKELVGDFANAGKEWRPTGEPEPVRVHDFIDKRLGKAIPYGVYDIGRNEGWVNVGIDHDTAEFAVESIRRWWRRMGRRAYPDASRLLLTADGGGSNGYRTRLWKLQLQRFADESGLDVTVAHYPPGTSKWNKIEHRMFCHITAELARSSARECRNRRQPHREHGDEDGTPHQGRPRPPPLREGHHGLRRTTRQSPHQAASLPRRMELHRSFIPDVTAYPSSLASVISGRRLRAYPDRRRERREARANPSTARSVRAGT